MVVLFEMREGRSKGAFIPGPLERYDALGIAIKRPLHLSWSHHCVQWEFE